MRDNHASVDVWKVPGNQHSCHGGTMERCPNCHSRTLASWKIQLSLIAFPVRCPECGGEFFSFRGITSWYVVGPVLFVLCAPTFVLMPLIQAVSVSVAVIGVAIWALSGPVKLVPVSATVKFTSRFVIIAVAVFVLFGIIAGKR
jgi:hypothetical protein